MKLLSTLTGLLILATAGSAYAKNSLIGAGVTHAIGKSRLAAKPDTDWNRVSHKDGKFIEVWTKDGTALNKVIFLSGLPAGTTMFASGSNHNNGLPGDAPLFSTDKKNENITELFELSYRNKFDIQSMNTYDDEPYRMANKDGVKFRYKMILKADKVERQGEAYAVISNGKLYLAAFEAPEIHFFEKDIAAFRNVVRSLKSLD